MKMNFYNELKVNKNFICTTFFGKLNADLNDSHCIVIKCDDVFEYFFNNKVLNDGGFGLSEFVNIKLPFNEIFVEMEQFGVKIGIYLVEEIISSRIVAVCYVKEKGQDAFIPMLYKIDISGDGEVLSVENEWNPDVKKWIQNDNLENQEIVCFGYLYTSLLTVQFMHCKNVELKEIDPNNDVPTRIKRHWEKKGRPSLTKHYILEIEPLKKILRTEGDIEHNGIKMALHICRGHFKDYGGGNGLFGKYKGLYWWDSQVRGKEEHGKIEKDYSVNPGKENG